MRTFDEWWARQPKSATEPIGPRDAWNAVLAAANACIGKLEAFKSYTHQRLDGMGVPHSVPESEHDKAGCRVGGRFDWVEKQLADTQRLLAVSQAREGALREWVRAVYTEHTLEDNFISDAAWLLDFPYNSTALDTMLAQHLAKAKREENEACVAVCEEVATNGKMRVTAKVCATLIHARMPVVKGGDQ